MDYNFFKKIDVSSSSFNEDYDMIITFTTQGIFFLNEGSGVVEYSFNGTTVHGELDSSNLTKFLSFDNRVVSTIWFRVKIGSSGTIKISVQAWGTP